jgi:hypothetical protein
VQIKNVFYLSDNLACTHYFHNLPKFISFDILKNSAMKKYIPLLLFIVLSISHINAQPALGMNYQAVARNASGTPVANTLVAVRVSILDGSPTGTVVYAERDTATTNSFGLFTTIIGNGQVLTGSFAGISWSSGNKYMEVDLDITGGTNYTTMGVTQLLSVPYAYYADSAGNPGPTGATGATGDIGPPGVAGNTGPSGMDGLVGLTGPSGAAGATGVTGPPGTTSYTGLTHSRLITNSGTISPWTNITTNGDDVIIIGPTYTSSGFIDGVQHNGGDEIIIYNNSSYTWTIRPGQTVPSIAFYTGPAAANFDILSGMSVRAFFEPSSNLWWVLNTQ